MSDTFNYRSETSLSDIGIEVARDYTLGMKGKALRRKYGSWLTKQVRRDLFMAIGREDLTQKDIERDAVKNLASLPSAQHTHPRGAQGA